MELLGRDIPAGTAASGSYYTPPQLVRELIKSALEPVIADHIAKAGTKDEKERALLSLRVLAAQQRCQSDADDEPEANGRRGPLLAGLKPYIAFVSPIAGWPS